MTEGDRLYVARLKQPDDLVLFIVVPKNSALESHIAWLFGFELQQELTFAALEFGKDDDGAIDFISRFVLDEIGVEFEDPNANTIDSIIERFGFEFPKTIPFSDHARLTLPGIDARDDPDAALMAWLNHEEAMFRRLERKIVSGRIAQGFVEAEEVDVDAFVSFSQSILQRRKSRMGYSFQNHLSAVFDAFELRYDPQVITENSKKPDFVFPGKAEYFDESFSVDLLTMLAAKSTCKDRWSQVLPEAARIPKKHLVTLEPGISIGQTQSMKAENLQLIVPASLQASYTQEQRDWLMNIADFVALVTNRQLAA